MTIQLSRGMPTIYKTTRPRIPLSPDRVPIEVRINDHLVLQLRRFEPTDLPYVHRLRTQEAVMVNTSTGVVDADLESSQKWMDRYLAPNDVHTYDLMIWVKANEQPWEHIGCIGCHILTPVPHLGYMLRTEWWGKSIATKSVQAFLQVWWNLDRIETEVSSADAKDDHDLHLMSLELNQTKQSQDLDLESKPDLKAVPEILLAEIEENNVGSKKVVERSGFECRDSELVVEDNGTFMLLDYIMSRPLSTE